MKPRAGRSALASIPPPEGAQEEEEEGVLALPDNVSLGSKYHNFMFKFQDNVNFTKQMKAKSKKIVMDAEHGNVCTVLSWLNLVAGEAKSAIDRCKKFLNGVESRSLVQTTSGSDAMTIFAAPSPVRSS